MTNPVTVDSVLALAEELYLHNDSRNHKRLEAAISQLVHDRDAWKRNHAELVHDFLPDFLECLPSCDSYGHSEDCPAVEPLAAQKALLADRDALLARNERLKSAIMENWCQDSGGHPPFEFWCVFCRADQTGDRVDQARISHTPDCIVIEKGGGQ